MDVNKIKLDKENIYIKFSTSTQFNKPWSREHVGWYEEHFNDGQKCEISEFKRTI